MDTEYSSLSDMGIDAESLICMALKARKNAYAPYSQYAVGAAVLLDNSDIVTGCNIENASYGAACCAERNAIFKAVSQGFKSFKAIAICGGNMNEPDIGDYAYPCGICRQVMREFVDPDDFVIIVAKSVKDYKVHRLSELLPQSFGPDNLKN